ncbi:S-adenosyl-L-methionine-dependent methyltransferase, partial [Atractiella rhizophila]
DVGGGIGTQTLIVLKSFPQLHGVVQDLPAVIENSANKYWEAEAPEILRNKRVTLMSHDFTQPQPIANASVYFFRAVLHDWSERTCLNILSALKGAMGPDSKVFVMEQFHQYACPQEKLPSMGEAYKPPSFDNSLLLPPSATTTISHLVDAQMLTYSTGCERDPSQFADLFDQGGFKVERIALQGMWTFYVASLKI